MPPRPRVREARGGCMQPQRRRETRQPGAAVHWAARRHKRSCGRHMCGLRDSICSLRGDIRGLWCGMRGLWAAYTVWTTACAVCAAGRARVHIGIFAYSLRICIHIRIQLCRCTCECAAWRFAAALAGAMSGVHPQMRAALGRPRCVSPGDAASPADARRSRPPAESVAARLCAAPQACSSAKKYAAAGKVHGFARGSCFLLPGCSILKAQGRAAAPPTSLF